YYASVSMTFDGPFPLRTLVPGVWYRIFWFYAHFCLFSGLSVLALTLWNSKTPYRKQQYTILSAAVPPILLNILYIAGFRPFGIIDLTPFAFVASGLILVWGMVRYRLLDLTPVARSTIVDNLVSPVLVLDLNGLKTLNDTYGHRAGDTYLRETARLLRKVFENKGFLARIGGDEFAFVGPSVDSHTIGSLEEELRCAIRQSRTSIDLSIGSAAREKEQTIRDALDTADRKMYEDKRKR
ncbi:MAG: histidine kinase N-terminal 7TM domain-containing protein, partial [Synergistota bacterium]|nr:histidine kinase N-terminal 7TM domain-containing protein [Synergistota bacterium]